MGMTAALLKRPAGVIVGCISVVVMGFAAFLAVPVNLHPKAQLPVLTISTELSDSDPEEVETLITKRMEDALADTPYLRRIQSYSRSGESELSIQFHYGKNVSEAALEVRSRIRRLLPSLPTDARLPVMTRYDPSDAPLAVLSVVGKGSLHDTAQWVTHFLKPQLSRLKGVAAVRVAGAPNTEIVIDCDVGRLKALNMTVHDISRAVEASHVTLPAGFVVANGRRLAVRTTGNLANLDEVSRQPIAVVGASDPLTVENMARVSEINLDPHEVTRLNGNTLITVAIFRSTDTDIRSLWKTIKSKLDVIREENPNAPKIEVIFTQAEELEKVINHLYSLMPITALITGTILFLFLGSISATFVVLTAIPFSLLITMLLMHIFKVSVDLTSLTGMTLGLGILVDNAIVVIEAISRRWSEGYDAVEGVAAGTDEVARPLLLSTITTVIVFVPVVFVSQDIRMFYRGFAWTVAVSLAASLVAALILIPVLFRYFGWRRGGGARSYINFDRVVEPYRRAFHFAVSHQLVVVLGVGLVLAFAGYFAKSVSFRQTDMGEAREFRVYMIFPPGTSIEHAGKTSVEVDAELLAVPGLERLYTEIKGNVASFRVSTKEGTQEKAALAFIEAAVKRLQETKVKECQFHVLPVGHEGDDRTVTFKIQGPTQQTVAELGEKVHEKLKGVAGIKDVIVRQGNPVPVLDFVVNHESLGYHGVVAKELAYEMRSTMTGPVAAKLTTGERQTRVRARVSRDLQDGLNPLEKTLVPTQQGRMIPFMELVTPEVRLRPTILMRENRRPVQMVSLVMDKDAAPLETAAQVEKVVGEMKIPPGCDYSFGDEIRDIVRTRKEMIAAGAVGLVLIYLVLIAATESLVQPLLIMVAVPFALAGAMSALWLARISIALPVYMGMIILCGLVINVNIVLVHTMNAFRDSGQPPDEAAWNGAQRRVRPIVMTVLTTVGGALPMLLDTGAGSNIWSPFALTLASGMVAAAVFSLVLTPTWFTAIEKIKRWIRGEGRGVAMQAAAPGE